MYIRKVYIEDVKGLRKVDLDLSRPNGDLAGWTVLAGENGTGKSTLLKAIALAVGGVTSASRMEPSFQGWIREGAEQAAVRVVLEWDERDRFEKGGSIPKKPVQVGLVWERATPTRATGGDEPVCKEMPELEGTAVTRYRGPWSSNPSGWFLAAYGPFRRLGKRDDYNEAGSIVVARTKSLFDEDFTLAESIHWLKDIYSRRLDCLDRARRLKEKNPKANTKDLEEEAASLDKIHFAVLSLLNDGFLQPKTKILDFNTEGLLVEQDGVALTLRQISDGQRAAIALVFDIVRQMHRCFGELDVEQDQHDSSVKVPYSGVVLIDEADAHLHVEWQKRLGFWLREHFPRVQFIVATHSPFICQAASPGGLIRLPPPGSNESPRPLTTPEYNTVVYGGADNAVISALFGVERAHSTAAEDLREQITALEMKLLRGGATKEDREELKQLQAKLPPLGTVAADQSLRKLQEMRRERDPSDSS